ncbi:S9 family peptidase [Roseateles oligotrophus]|uniref:S9 family peptidase n=1 Tax=Roseateles oligotrophus TaxID=1769250 RepID=A0ABT2YB60_9BURK|nr:S9 family peptidase [Roseateles oligotrophus]MCV2367538.1 S9 family peptidase [Roseateles oligotrophus]
MTIKALRRALLCLLSGVAAAASVGAQSVPTQPARSALSTTELAPPQAERRPKDVSVHGDARIDDYFWLREGDKPDVLQHLNAESAYSAAWFKPLAAQQEMLYQELVGRIKQADEAVPVREGAWWYSSRTLAGAQYPQHIRRPAQGRQRGFDASAPEQILLDLNELAKGRKFLALGGLQVSPDAKLLAYSIDETGALDFELKLRDLASGEDLAWAQKNVSGFAWAADKRSIFYLTHNAAKRSNKLWRHRLNATGPDALIYEDADELFNLQLSRSADGRYLQLLSSSKDSSELRLLPSDRPLGNWLTVLPRRAGQEYSVEHRDGQLYVLINDRGPNFRLVRTPLKGLPLSATRLSQAQELLAHREDAMLEELTMFKRQLVLQVREAGAVKLRVYGLATEPSIDFKPQELKFEQSVYTANSGGRLLNREYDSEYLRLNFQSMTTPASVYDYDFASKRLMLRKVQPVLGGFDPQRYESKRIWSVAKDGTRVPVSLVYAKDLRRGGPQPLLLQAYGSYGVSSDPRFSSVGLSLLNRGVILAIAHVRGGGDLGRRWYLEGKLAKKMNTFTDFIGASEALIEQGYTSPQQLIITGGSAGGLLMGAVVNLRPDLFKAVVAEVPFVDVINTMLDETLPLTTEEFIEWGNPKIAEQYAWMRAYSPYDNLKAGVYPAMLLRTGLNDSQVPYWEPAKYVAKLRTLKAAADQSPLLFDINMSAGHGGASGRFDALRERAKVYTFMLQQWGLLGGAAP